MKIFDEALSDKWENTICENCQKLKETYYVEFPGMRYAFICEECFPIVKMEYLLQ